MSSGASVKCSILFVQKYTQEERNKWIELLGNCKAEIWTKYRTEYGTLEGKSEDKSTPALDKKKTKTDLRDLDKLIEKEGKELAREEWDYPIFMAEPESVGITSTGETGDNVSNDLKDLVEIDDQDNETIIEKGIISYFREFLEEHHISWGSKHD